MKNEKVKSKNGFFDLAKHGLNKHGISEDQIWSPKERPNRRDRERRGKERRRGRGREEEEKERRSS